jgi:hypothetical protein
MSDTPGPIHRYLCGSLYVGGGLAMATAGATALCGDQPGAALQLAGGLAVAIVGGAVVRESRRQSQLDATCGAPASAVERPTTTVRRAASSVEDATRRASPTQQDLAFRPAWLSTTSVCVATRSAQMADICLASLCSPRQPAGLVPVDESAPLGMGRPVGTSQRSWAEPL